MLSSIQNALIPPPIPSNPSPVPPDPFKPITPVSELNVTYPFIPIGTSNPIPPPFSPPPLNPYAPLQGIQRPIHYVRYLIRLKKFMEKLSLEWICMGLKGPCQKYIGYFFYNSSFRRGSFNNNRNVPPIPLAAAPGYVGGDAYVDSTVLQYSKKPLQDQSKVMRHPIILFSPHSDEALSITTGIFLRFHSLLHQFSEILNEFITPILGYVGGDAYVDSTVLQYSKKPLPDTDFSLDSRPVIVNKDRLPSPAEETGRKLIRPRSISGPYRENQEESESYGKLQLFARNHPTFMQSLGTRLPSKESGLIPPKLNVGDAPRSALSPNEKLDLCCRKRAVNPACQSMCNFDVLNEQTVRFLCPAYIF
ncbi:unnamed protein product [Haemonchus placei]|uniref:Uncharacterized protein n=1 Tax=Haemonchus placei TaxID=6290 RepID=A0A0N4X9A9_HAEPC|nr:unnamed protein product [Haemonchus placei]